MVVRNIMSKLDDRQIAYDPENKVSGVYVYQDKDGKVKLVTYDFDCRHIHNLDLEAARKELLLLLQAGAAEECGCCGGDVKACPCVIADKTFGTSTFPVCSTHTSVEDIKLGSPSKLHAPDDVAGDWKELVDELARPENFRRCHHYGQCCVGQAGH